MRLLIIILSIFFAFSGLNAAHISDIENTVEEKFYNLVNTNLSCNYNLWDYRFHELVKEIKNPVIFKHLESGKVETTEYIGIIMGEKPCQRVQIIDGVKRRIRVKQVLDFKELYEWVREIEKSLS